MSGHSNVEEKWITKQIDHCNKSEYAKYGMDAGGFCSSVGLLALPDLGPTDPRVELAFQRACALPNLLGQAGSGAGTAHDRCSALGKLYLLRGETAKAVTVFKLALSGQVPDSNDVGGRVLNGFKCLEDLAGLYDLIGGLSQERKIEGQICSQFNAVNDCERYNALGGSVDVNSVAAAAAQQEQAAERSREAAAEEARERTQEHNARFNAIVGALQSMPGGNDPNAIQNTANQQSAQIMAIGAANDAARQQAALAAERQREAQARAVAQQAAEQAAQQKAAAQEAAQQAAQQSSPAAASPSATSNSCSAVTAPNQPPSHKDHPEWGPWMFLGSSGIAVSVSRVDSKTLTWEFYNGRPDTVASFQFNYTYVDADSGQSTTQKDTAATSWKPGQGEGGWTDYTANTRGSVSFVITQMTCK